MEPTVTTAGSKGESSRLTMVWIARMNLRRFHDGMLGHLRGGTVTTDAAQGDINRSRTGHRIAGSIPDFTCLDEKECRAKPRLIGAREARIEAVVKHGLGSADGFLRGLRHHHQRAAPLVLHFHQHFGRAQK